MDWLRRLGWNRRRRAPQLFESFLVAAVGSFLGIRALLAVTGYPQLGGNGLHIAHMLWGGLLMLVALLLVIGFLDRPTLHLAAIVGGLGFGTFIDEIGKFVTADNDYFFRPAVALIYVVFIALFLVARALAGGSRLDGHESVANALEELQATFDRPIDDDDRADLLALLARADETSGMAPIVRRYVTSLPRGRNTDDAFEAVGRRLATSYEWLLGRAWFERGVGLAFGAYALVAVVGVVVLATAEPTASGDAARVAQLGQVTAVLVGAALIAIGVSRLWVSREQAYRWLTRGLLVWILVAQIFVFYSSQLVGLGGLAIDLVAYATVRFALQREVKAAERRRSSRPGAAEATTAG